MPSKTNEHDVANGPAPSISERAAEATQATARRAAGVGAGVGAGVRSELLRAREIPSFSLGRKRTDVRGWQVYSNDAELVGTVSSIFVDMRTKAVRYLGVALTTPRLRSTKAANEVLIPIGSVSRPDDRQIVVVNALSRAQLVAAPRVSNRPVTRADEHAALTTYGMQRGTSAGAHDLYGTPLFEEWRLFGGAQSRNALP